MEWSGQKQGRVFQQAHSNPTTTSPDSKSTRSIVWRARSRKAAKSNSNFLWKLVSLLAPSLSLSLVCPHPFRLSGRIGIIFGSAAPLPQSSTHACNSYRAAKNRRIERYLFHMSISNLTVQNLIPITFCLYFILFILLGPVRVEDGTGRSWSGGDVIAGKELSNGEK